MQKKSYPLFYCQANVLFRLLWVIAFLFTKLFSSFHFACQVFEAFFLREPTKEEITDSGFDEDYDSDEEEDSDDEFDEDSEDLDTDSDKDLDNDFSDFDDDWEDEDEDELEK